MKLISVVTPAYNESECVDELSRRLGLVFDSLRDRYEFEVIVVENGSVDTTYEKLLAIHQRDPRFKIVRLSRNFGIEGAFTAGMRRARGEAAILMCADLQDPPEVLPRFIELWEEGYENIYGVITRRNDESRVRQFLTKIFYWLMDAVSDVKIPRNASDFRLVDRHAYEAYNSMTEHKRLTRAMYAWLGFKSIGVEHERPPRFGGKSTYHLLGNIRFALDGIMSSSVAPLRIIPLFGLTLSALSFLGVCVGAVIWFGYGVPFAGFGSIMGLILLMFGLLFFFLGLLSEYVGMIYLEVRARPNFVLRAVHGFDDEVPLRRPDVTPGNGAYVKR
ncbi:MAG: glycosyltransferase family 2 protein [Candidatus Eremiobacteraeota bacterium]|nr:glycosyltransferase family 2 protein [Candidatus Eremiobacteraeota bacterium]